MWKTRTAGSAYGLIRGLNVVGVLAVGALSDRWGRKHPNILLTNRPGRCGAFPPVKRSFPQSPQPLQTAPRCE